MNNQDIPTGTTHVNKNETIYRYYKKIEDVFMVWYSFEAKWAVSTCATTEWVKENLTPINQEPKIDWDCEEAKGKDWCLYGEKWNNYIFYKLKPSNNGVNWEQSPEFCGMPRVEYYTLHERPKPSIYTQEMHDAGEKCEVGMQFQNKNGTVYKKLLPSDSDGMTVVLLNGEYHIFDESCIKPIDTRTQAEKDEDDTIKRLDFLVAKYKKYKENGKISEPEYTLGKWIYNNIMGESVKHIKYTGAK